MGQCIVSEAKKKKEKKKGEQNSLASFRSLMEY
jgi:hypothetical protein